MKTVRLLGIATLALAGAGIALFAPLAVSEGCTSTLREVGGGVVTTELHCESDRSSLLEDEGVALALALASSIVAPAAVVALAAMSDRALARVALWVGALWLVGLTLLALASVGLFVAPAALAALAAAWASGPSRDAARPARTGPRHTAEN